MTELLPEGLVQGQFDAYNRQDVDTFCSFFSDDIVLATYNGAVLTEGQAALRKRHVDLFAQFPQNRAILVHRIVLGDKVIDHEDVERAPGGDTFQVACIYTIANGRITRVDYVKAS